MIEQFLGYDAREMWRGFRETWSEQRIEMYLLREDNITKPLSTSQLGWDSVFDSAFEEDTIETDFYKGQYRLWDSLNQMTEYLAKAWKTEWKPCWFIAISCVLTDEKARTISNPNVDPVPQKNELTLLGYDISGDTLYISGLSNCGYGQERQHLMEEWGPRLNQYHLFTNQEDAQQFRDITNKRVSEHEPFFVYGLYLVERHD